MHLKELQPGIFLKKAPFLVAKQLADNEVRVYSKLHGNLTTFDFDVNKFLRFFDSPIEIEAAIDKISEACQCEPSGLIHDLFEKRFLVEGNRNDKDMLSEYVEIVRFRNRFPRISKVTFLISGKCNLACKGCYHNFYDFKSADMTGGFAREILKGLFAYLKERDIPALLISFLGYEPLVNFETLREIHGQALSLSEEYDTETKFKIFTNAFSISEKIYKWISENKSDLGIKVSLDGIKEDNDRRRVDLAGRGTYGQVVGNLKRIITTGVDCGVLIVLSKLNFHNIERFVDEMAAIGIKNITANMFCGQSPEERLMELTESEKFEAIRRMDAATEKYGIEFDGEWKFAVLQMITGAQFSCPAGIKQLVFSADGAMYPCQRFAGTTMNFGRYEKDFWEKLTEGQCEGYGNWVAGLYDGVLDRAKEEHMDLTGWSCPFLPFIRGECLGKNLERELNENLLEYYVTRPLERIVAKSPMSYSY
jgi:uncharacterized protein